MIYIEGKGAVLLKHKVNGRTIKTRLEHVLHMPQITTRLLSTGQFLLQGMRVSGDAVATHYFIKVARMMWGLIWR
jgi:hypothetical protein